MPRIVAERGAPGLKESDPAAKAWDDLLDACAGTLYAG
jgi:hypothetical protein